MNDNISNSPWDVLCIGGGAAGFFTAIRTAELSPTPLRIGILEKTGQVLNKVKISGGGRCNVTHDCLQPKPLTGNYPRGGKSLIGPFHHFGPTETIAWFSENGVELKTEADGRMFPTTDSSQTIIDCLTTRAEDEGIQTLLRTSVTHIEHQENLFHLTLKDGSRLTSRALVLSTGGTRLPASAQLAENLGHTLIPPVPSLFTFTIEHPLLEGLEGVSVNPASLKITGLPYQTEGPMLITHWGLSGPATLKLSAQAARELAECEYEFSLEVNWCQKVDLNALFSLKRQEWGKRQLLSRSPLASIPKRLWQAFCEQADITPQATWAQLSKPQAETLKTLLQKCSLPVTGKSLNKEEFVTAGGVDLKELHLKTFESRLIPNLYFSGEVLNIDGVTGGFNFQNAWTTSHLVGSALSQRLTSPC